LKEKGKAKCFPFRSLIINRGLAPFGVNQKIATPSGCVESGSKIPAEFLSHP
jgi:hypothetical protein